MGVHQTVRSSGLASAGFYLRGSKSIMSRSLKIRLGIGLALMVLISFAYDKVVEFVNRPPTLAANVRILDGDSLVLDGRAINLYGVDAPELKQICGSERQRIRCGQQARASLESIFIGAEQIVCEDKAADNQGTSKAVCMVKGLDVNAEMVRRGQALANRYEAFIYTDEEDEARVAVRGLWAAPFEMPWDWRQAQMK